MNRRDFIRIAGAGGAAGIIFNDLPAAASVRKYSDLQDHRITDIDFTTVILNFKNTINMNFTGNSTDKQLEEPVHILYTNKGATGWGITRGSQEKASEIFGLIKGQPLSDLIVPESGVILPDFSIFDFSLFDLAGKIVRKPVFQLLGKRRPEKFFCCISTDTDTDDPDTIIQKLRDDYNLGYRQLKLIYRQKNTGRERKDEIEKFISTTRLIADVFPDCDILVDGNEMFTVDEFLQIMEGLEGLTIYRIESPFTESIDNYVKLYSWLRVHNMNPLLADGSVNPDETVLRQLGAQNIIDVFTHDIVKTGFTGWIKLVQETEKMGHITSPYTGASLIRSYYASHLAAAYSNIATVDFMPCSSADIKFPGYKIRKGKLVLSPEPGFGMDLIK